MATTPSVLSRQYFSRKKTRMHQDVGSRAQSSEVGCDLAPVVEHFITRYPARKSRVEEALEEEEIIIIIGRVFNFYV